MPLKLGVDFGTATICVATIRDAATLIPELVPVSGRELNDSAVWFEWKSERPIIVRSMGQHPRHPTRVFREATEDFSSYWQSRIKAQQEYASWDTWLNQDREGSMLLTYFKPELADEPVLHSRRVVVGSRSSFDPLKQSEDCLDYTAIRTIADPAPDTDDYVSGAAALLRTVASAAARRFGEQIESLVIGIPSLDEAHNAEELKRARERRDTAVRLAAIKTDLGTPAFSVRFCSEAFAAANGLVPSSDQDRTLSVVIDIGAGTTDFALVEYRRGKAGRLEATKEVYHSSVRTAGRDLNAAIAEYLKERMDVREVFRAMDERSWQVLLDDDIERIKRGLASCEDYFRIDLRRLAAHWTGCTVDEELRQRLKRVLPISLDLGDVKPALNRFARQWEQGFANFLAGAEHNSSAAEIAKIAGISVVGGAARFQPMLEIVQAAIDASPWRGTRADYQDKSGEAQTAVARGLARRALLEA